MDNKQQNTGRPQSMNHQKDIYYFSSFGKRVSALLIDTAIIIPILWFFGLAGIPEGYEIGIQIRPLGIVFILIYYIALEASPLRASLGKLATSQTITDEAGEDISFMHTIGRNLAKILTIMTIMLGFLTILFTKRSQALHDLSSRTCVMSRHGD